MNIQIKLYLATRKEVYFKFWTIQIDEDKSKITFQPCKQKL